MRKIKAILIGIFYVMLSMTVLNAWAAPQASEPILTDVTTRSFSVVWTTDIPATGNIEVFQDAAGLIPSNDILIENISGLYPPAEDNGVLKVRASGLRANTTYYFKTISDALYESGRTIYPLTSPLPAVTTEHLVVRSFISETEEFPFSNDIFGVGVYQQDGSTPATGLLVLLKVDGADYPVSSFVGQGIASPAAIIDMNNIFNASDRMTLDISGSENAHLNLIGGIMGNSVQPITLLVDNEQCAFVWATSGTVSIIPDSDSDGINNDIDNCPETYNPGQENTDHDAYGNACDADLDNDGFVGPNDYNMFGACWWMDCSNPFWVTYYCANADFDSDCFVGPNDYNILGTRWWTIAPWK